MKKILVLLKIYKGDLNTFDETALEAALRFPYSEVQVLSMCPMSAEGSLRKLTRLGVKSILVSDAAYAGSDTVATSTILAKAINRYNPDLVFTGRNSFDGDTGQTPFMLSELLSFQMISHVIKIDSNHVETRENEAFDLNEKQIVSFEKIFPLRSPSIFSKENNVEVIDNSVLNININDIGFNGSPTIVNKSFPNEDNRRFVKFKEFSELDTLIKEALNAKDNNVTEEVEKAPFGLYVGNIEPIAKKYFVSYEKLDIKDKTLEQIEEEIQNKNASAILWEEALPYKEIASRIAIRMRAGLCADCIKFAYRNGVFYMTRPALGGNINAEIYCKSAISMATIKSPKATNDVVFSLGRGSLSNLETVKELAKKYNALIVCSRPLADSDVFPYSYQVGLTGKQISPKVLVTIGIDGAIQHIVGICTSGTIISINKGKNAPIFDYSDYGIVMDVNNIKL